MSIATLPTPVLLVGLTCSTVFLISLLMVVACVPGAAERIILLLDAVYNLFYVKHQRCNKRQHGRKTTLADAEERGEHS
jgi:hypothetical protein